MTSTKLYEWLGNGSKVIVSNDRMKAELYLCPPPENETYSVDMICHFLEANQIKNGISERAIEGLLQRKEYSSRVLVASGTPAQDGKDGRYEYFFETETNKKPKLMPDGSVDYRTMAGIPTVSEGSEIAHYYPADEGADGIDLYGNVVRAKKGKDSPQLKGKGFTVSEDKQSYIALMSGKIVMENGRISVQNFLEIKEDIDALTGDISFDGDVLIHGNVNGGRRVQAGGNLTIEGHVESCELTAGGDIMLTHGMQGGGRGVISCKGSVSGKFFEQVEITAGGNVSANSILSCNVRAGGDIEVAGRHGAIIGGRVLSGHFIQAATVGNASEVQTELVAGESGELEEKIRRLELESEDLQRQMDKTKMILQRLTMQKEPASLEVRMQAMQLTRLKITLDSKLKINSQERKELLEKLALAEEAKIVVHRNVNRGTTITMNGESFLVKDMIYKATFRKTEEGIKYYNN